MIEIKKNRSEIDLNIKFGAFKLILSDSSKNINVSSNKETLKLKSSGSDLSVFELDSDLRVDVLKGKVKLSRSGDKNMIEAKEKETVVTNKRKVMVKKTKVLPRKKIKPLARVYNLINKGYAEPSMKIKPIGTVNVLNSNSLVASDEKPVQFLFKGANAGILEISKYPDFSIINSKIKVIESSSNEQLVKIKVKDIGKFYWRFQSHKGEFISKEPPIPLSPLVPKTQNLKSLPIEEETYLFKWNPVKNAEKYELVIYELSGNWIIKKKAVVYESEYLWKEDIVDSYRFKVRAVDKWGRRSKFSKSGKLLSPISPFSKINQKKK